MSAHERPLYSQVVASGTSPHHDAPLSATTPAPAATSAHPADAAIRQTHECNMVDATVIGTARSSLPGAVPNSTAAEAPAAQCSTTESGAEAAPSQPSPVTENTANTVPQSQASPPGGRRTPSPLPPIEERAKEAARSEPPITPIQEEGEHHNLEVPSPSNRSPRISIVSSDGEVLLPSDMELDDSGPGTPVSINKTMSAPISAPVEMASSNPELMVDAQADEDRSPERIRRPSILRRFSAYDHVQGFPGSSRRSSTVSFDEKETVHYVYSSRAYDRSYSKTEEEMMAAVYVPRHMMMSGMW